MEKMWVVFDWDDYEGSMGPQSVWSNEELAQKEIIALSKEQPHTKFRYEEFEVD